MRSLAAATCMLLSFTTAAHAENWPQWRGPSLNGISTETNLPVQWTTTENIAWKLPMPSLTGSTPIIWGDRIFLNVAENGSLFLWAVDRAKGEPIWKRHLSDGDNRQRLRVVDRSNGVADFDVVYPGKGDNLAKPGALDWFALQPLKGIQL